MTITINGPTFFLGIVVVVCITIGLTFLFCGDDDLFHPATPPTVVPGVPVLDESGYRPVVIYEPIGDEIEVRFAFQPGRYYRNPIQPPVVYPRPTSRIDYTLAATGALYVTVVRSSGVEQYQLFACV